MASRILCASRLFGIALFLLSGCTLHHVRDQGPVLVTLSGEPASLRVETRETSRGGERVLVTVEHPKNIDLEGAIGSDAELVTPLGDPIDPCRRQSLTRVSIGDGLDRSQALFYCRWPLTQPASLTIDNNWVPVLNGSGLPIIGDQPWLLSGWVKGEMGGRVTGTADTRGIDLGVNIGARGIVLQHLSFGGRGDILVDTQKGGGEALFGPEAGFVHAIWPCSRCSFEASISYLVGYTRGFAHGPEADLRFGVRFLRTSQSWHGAEIGVGYRQLIGPDSGGSLIFTLSYTLQRALRSVLPASLRAPPRGLPPDDAEAAPARDDNPKEGDEPPSVSVEGGAKKELQAPRS